jgi:hypothetical protein
MQKLYCYVVSVIFLFSVFGGKAQVSYSTTTPHTGMEFTGSGTGVVQTPDINQDGFPDIIYVTGIGGAIVYLQNNGGSSFSTPSPNPFASYTSATPSGFTLSTSSSIADFDGDGDLDIWVRISGAANDIYLQNNSGTYITGSVLPGMEFTAASVVQAQTPDINLDGLPDIVFITAASGPITYLQNNSGTSFSTPSPNPFASYTGSTPTNFVLASNLCSIADFDGDGDLDIWTRVLNAGNDVFLKNNSGSYATSPLITGMEFTASTGSGAGHVADMNGDGLVDIFYQTANAGPITYLQNNNGTSFSTPASNPFINYAFSTPTGTNLAVGTSIVDFNGDGDYDIWARQSGSGNDFYSTALGAAPKIITTSPAHNATDVSNTSNITLNFSENVFAGTGSFFIHKSSDNSIVETISANSSAVSGSGTSSIIIDPATNLDPGTSYYVTFSRLALADASGVIAGHLDLNFRQRVPETSSNFLSFATAGNLPVTLVDFTASLFNKTTLLTWETSSEFNSDHFKIQHSTNGRSWTTIGNIAAQGNSNATKQYRFEHLSPSAGNNYYRLVQADLDGRTKLSGVRLVKLLSEGQFELFPNPSKGDAFVLFSEPAATTVQVYDMSGKVVYQTIQNDMKIRIPLSNKAPGVYTIIIDRNGERFTRRLIRE